MKKRTVTIAIFCLGFASVGVVQLWADTELVSSEDVVPINVDQFPIAETHHMMKASIAMFDCLGRWDHMVLRCQVDTFVHSQVMPLAGSCLEECTNVSTWHLRKLT